MSHAHRANHRPSFVGVALWLSIVAGSGLALNPVSAALGQVTRLPAVELRPDGAVPRETLSGVPRDALRPSPVSDARIDVRMASHPDGSDEPFQAPGRPSLPPSLLPPGSSPWDHGTSHGQAAPWLAGPPPPAQMPPPDSSFDPILDETLDPALGPVMGAGEQQDEGDLPPGARQGIFQKLTLEGAWLPRMGDRGVGMNDVKLQTVLAVPFPTIRSPLLIVPGFEVHYLDGPRGGHHRDLPPRLYDAYIQFRWLRPVTDRLALDLSFTPGYFSDFEQSSDAAMRYSGHAFAAWDWTPRLKLIVGAVYIDRDDVGVLPGAGLIWKPHDDLSIEALFPRPRIARRIRMLDFYFPAYRMIPSGGKPPEVEHWLYAAGELGGGLWAIERSDGTADELNYRDFRIILGLERKVPGGLGSYFEVAYVLGRKFQYGSNTPDFEPADTLMLRGGVTY